MNACAPIINECKVQQHEFPYKKWGVSVGQKSSVMMKNRLELGGGGERERETEQILWTFIRRQINIVPDLWSDAFSVLGGKASISYSCLSSNRYTERHSQARDVSVATLKTHTHTHTQTNNTTVLLAPKYWNNSPFMQQQQKVCARQIKPSKYVPVRTLTYLEW